MLENLDIDMGFDPYDYTVTEDIFYSPAPSSTPNSGFGFQDILKAGTSLLGAFGGGSSADNPIGTAQTAGNQLAYNLGQSAQTAALAAQGLGIRGQLLGAGTGFVGEDAQLNRETNAILRSQQLNNTNLSRESRARDFKMSMAGRMNPMAIARASAMAYGV